MSFASIPWRKEANYPLGTLFDGGIHVIAAIKKRSLGDPKNVWATGKKLRQEYGEFDHVAMLFHYANGSNRHVEPFQLSLARPESLHHLWLCGDDCG